MHHAERHPGFRVAVGVSLAVLALAPGSANAAPADDSYISVTVNGEPVNVEGTLASQGFDVTMQSYTLCDSSGTQSTVTLSGWSVGRLLAAAGTTPDKVTSISVPRTAAAGDVVLHPADYDPSAPGYPSFPEGPALVVRRTTGASNSPADDFFRPYRSPSCAADPNAGDHVVTPVGAALTVAIASGTELAVSDTVDHSQLSVGQTATFTASVANPPSGDPLSYRWQFGDGTLGSGQTVTHAFTSVGSYSALLTVDSGAAAGGAASPLAITVGSAAGPTGAGTTAKPRQSTPAKTPTTRATHATHPVTSVAPSSVVRPSTAALGMAPASISTTAVPAPVLASAASVTPVPVASAPVSSAPVSSATATPGPAAAEPGVSVDGHAITLLGPAQPAVASGQVAALQQALGPDGTTTSPTGPDWAPIAGGGGVLLCLAAGAGAELLGGRRGVRRNDRKRAAGNRAA